MILGVHRKGSRPDDVLETYIFNFTYMDNKINTLQMVQNDEPVATVELCTDPKAVLRCATQMMRGTLCLVQALEPLPGDVELSMKLKYYDQVTPADYEPPGFTPCETEAYNFDGNPLNINIGKLLTPYHELTFQCKTDTARFDASRKPCAMAGNSNGDPEGQYSFIWDQTPSEEVTQVATQFDWMLEPQKSEDSDDCIPPSPYVSAPNLWQKSVTIEPVIKVEVPVPSRGLSAEMDANTSDKPRASICACGGDRQMGLVMSCDVCLSWSHAACYGFIEESEIPQRFVCLHCHSEMKGTLCADTKLLALELQQRQEICMYRRALVLCQEMDLISAAKLSREMYIDRITTADRIVKRLESDNIIQKSRARSASRMVNHEILKKNVLKQYFGPTATLGLTLKPGVKKSIKANPTATLGFERRTKLRKRIKVYPTASRGLDLKIKVEKSTNLGPNSTLGLDLKTEVQKSTKVGSTATLGLDLKTEVQKSTKVGSTATLGLDLKTEVQKSTKVGSTATLGLDLKTEVQKSTKVGSTATLGLDLKTEVQKSTKVGSTATLGLDLKTKVQKSTKVGATAILGLDQKTQVEKSTKRMQEMRLAPPITRIRKRYLLERMQEMRLAPPITRIRKRYLLEESITAAKEKLRAKRTRTSQGDKLMVKRLR